MSLSRAAGWALVAIQDQGLLAPFYEAQLALAGGAPIGAPKMLSGLRAHNSVL
jgi:hypothetical protein